MSAKDKENKTISKLKQFFRINKGGSGNFRGREDFALTQDIERDISPETPLNQRVKVIRELSEALLTNHIEDNAIEKLWVCLQDLLQRDVAREHRHLAFSLFRCLVQGQYEKLGLMRVHFFKVIKTHDIPEDVSPRFELLQSLTENGKDILYFEEEVGPFLLQWLPAVTAVGRTQEFLAMLVNVIKYNAAYVDEDIITGLVQNTCYLCCCSNSQEVVLTCLQVLDTVVCYSNLPSHSLPTFITALCRTVNFEAYCQSSWKIMRNLLGTHMGHSALYTMCRLLQEPSSLQDVHLLRGAVFYVNMGLWSNKRVPSLKYTPTSVLPSFLCAMECNNSEVMYEITLSIQRLVTKYGLELQDSAWDLVLSIVENTIQHIELDVGTNSTSVASHLHETISTVEQLIEKGQFNGSVQQVFDLVERCSPLRPDSSVLRLVSFLAASIVPTRPFWLSKLNTLLERYFRDETRTNIRVKVLGVLSSVIQTNRASYEEDLIERIVVPHLQHIDMDADIVVRNTAAQLLVDLCIECESKRCLELLDIIAKLLSRPLEQQASDPVTGLTDTDVMDVKTVVMGLIGIFVTKLYQLPSSHAIKAYKLLVTHLDSHYAKPQVLELTSNIRYMIFESFLKMRANSLYHLGLPAPGSGELRFSPYLAVDYKDGERPGGSGSPPPMSPAPTSYPVCIVTHISLTYACKAVIMGLKQERDWKVLQLILQELPQVMQNKALILSRHGNDIDSLASALCSMVSDKSLQLPEVLRNTPAKLTRSEFHSHVLPVLASLASYHAFLEPSLQQRLIKCLEFGLVSRCARQCITALTTCTLEMRDAMYKLLPEVLLNLSKISATVHIAIPILEFLSTLTCLPKVFASFVGDQYMSVFAISLPYTNPFKYNHYTVSLAHHVIATWFLKCRLPFRRDFVKFITTGLKANVLVPFEEGQVMKSELVNEDSSNRKRSSSLTEQGSRRSVKPLAPANRLDMKPPKDESLMTFHMELTETCIDLMARYTFSVCSALPKRLPTADFLLSGGQAMTWLLGNKLITVTTSGCSQKVLRNGLCDRCWALCRTDREIGSPDCDRDLQRLHKVGVQGAPRNEAQGKEDGNVAGRVSRQVSLDQSRAPSKSCTPATTTPATAATTAANSPSGALHESHQPEPFKLDQLLFGSQESEKQERQFCACWCQGWAEIYIRRPTGDMSWAMRIQNQTQYQTSALDFPLADVTTLFMPSLTHDKDSEQFDSDDLLDSECNSEDGEGLARLLGSNTEPSGPIGIPGSPIRRHSRDSAEGSDTTTGEPQDLEMEGGENDKPRNLVRRSNSSPEMSASWKNPFLKDLKQDREIPAEEGGAGDDKEVKKASKQLYNKDSRVSCEAIPEEISGLGTTPPSCDDTKPSLLSCHSYPGTAQPSPSTNPQAANRTVPPSPTSLTSPQSNVLAAALTSQQSAGTAKPPQSPSPLRGSNAAADTRMTDLKFPPQKPDAVLKPQGRQPPPLGQLTVNTAPPADKGWKEEPCRPDPSALPPLAFKRGRGHTISVMSPVRKPHMDWTGKSRDNSPRGKDTSRSGMSPSFVFLQLYHTAHFGSTPEKPLLVSQSKVIERAVKNLDLIPQYETHKLGVVYVGPGQAGNETDIFRNQFGSLRYAEFLQRLGTLVNLKDAASQNIFLGGLDRNGDDGKFAYIWQDDVLQVTFHVATLMPTKETDPLCSDKKKHIGNDYVTIVYNSSGKDYNIQTVKGQFNYACVVIQPLDHNTNQVTVKTKEVLTEHIGHSEPKIVSDQNLAILARQLALHANLASMICCKKAQGQDPYASNWLERLRQIKRLRSKVLQEAGATADGSSADEPLTSPRSSRRVHMDDFTEYT